MILTKESIDKGYDGIRKDLEVAKGTLKHDKEAIERLETTISSNLELLMENWNFETIDSFLPYFYEKPSSLFDYIQNALVIVTDVQRCVGKIDSVYFEFEENYKDFLKEEIYLRAI
jgi:transcription-repair coupling factor (superfamily II helicase)